MSAEPKDSAMGSPPICQIVTPIGNMGYGFDETTTAYQLAQLVPNGIPTAIILDSGSTDSGPEKLALGTTTAPISAYLKDLTKLLRLVHQFRVPLIFSSAGGDGTNDHVNKMREIIETIAAEEVNSDYFIKAISIYAEIDKDLIRERLQVGRLVGCGTCVPPLAESEIESSARVVAQMGPEPFIDAMEANPDFTVIIGGRSYDPAPYAAYASYQLKRQHPELTESEIQQRYGGFVHMGKIMECGGACSTPKSPGAVAVVYEDGTFDISPTFPGSRCTPLSVAAHALYENSRPDVLRGPGGALHLENSKYEQLPDGRTTRVSGSEYRPSQSQSSPYQFKLEAARVIGYRSMFMGSVKDHILIKNVDNLFGRIKLYVKEQHPDIKGEWDLEFHVYGRGQSTPKGPGELFIIAEAIAENQKLATSIASKARVAMIHGPYPGMKATAGNFAFGIGGKMEIELGKCAKFSIYHLMDLEPGEERLRPTLGAVNERKLLSYTTSIIGNGKPTPSDDTFRAEIARLRDSLPAPVAKGAVHVAATKSAAPSESPETLWDLAAVLRSKNAGPFDISLDVIFKTKEDFHAVKNSNFLSAENVSRALEIDKKDIVWIGFFEPALAFKVTIPRFRGGKKTPAGSFMENDVHGSQQHVGLGAMALPGGLRGPSKTLWERCQTSVAAYVAIGAFLMTVGGVKGFLLGRATSRSR
ncbi:hypothetical protein V2G26_013249 [Clonostachys chloroleuca]